MEKPSAVMPDPLNIIFAGTPEFAVPMLDALWASPHRLISIYTQPDRPAGRGRKLRPSPVKQWAEAHQLKVFQPLTLRDEPVQRQLAEQKPDLLVVVAYGLILPQAVLDIPELGCINVHASLLPRWRGAAPIQRAILEGDQVTGVTIMQMEAGLDTGPVLSRAQCVIEPQDTAQSLHDRLSQLGADLLLHTLTRCQTGQITPEIQDESLACYAEKIDKRQAVINWTRSARALQHQVQAFNPWPVAQTTYQDKVLRIWSAQAREYATQALPGTVQGTHEDGIDVATGDGILRLLEVQLPGGKPMSAANFLNSRDLSGCVLGNGEDQGAPRS